jgi:hypothetical protein
MDVVLNLQKRKEEAVTEARVDLVRECENVHKVGTGQDQMIVIQDLHLALDPNQTVAPIHLMLDAASLAPVHMSAGHDLVIKEKGLIPRVIVQDGRDLGLLTSKNVQGI